MLPKILIGAGLAAIVQAASITSAQAACSSYPYTLTNGTTADATQVMADFNCAALTQNASFAGTTLFNGNVGIGTTSPNNALMVQGAIQFDGNGLAPVLSYGQGGILAWNITNGIGETDIVNERGGGPGGFYFYNATVGGALGSPIAIIDPNGTYVASDARVKFDVTALSPKDSLAALGRLRPVSYKLASYPDGDEQYGFLAQDVQRIFPGLVKNTHAVSDKTPDGELVLNYVGLIAPTIEAVKALDSRTATSQNDVAGLLHTANILKATVAEQDREIMSLEDHVASLERLINTRTVQK